MVTSMLKTESADAVHKTTHFDIEQWAISKLDELRTRADEIVMLYYARVMAEGRNRNKSEHGRVGVRVRDQRGVRAAAGSFVIEWVQYQYVNRNPGAGSKAFTTYIQRGKGDRYPRSSFRALAKPWQIAIIDDAEEQLGRIRALSRSIGKVRMQMRQHQRLEDKLRPLIIQRLPSCKEAAGAPRSI
jgi:hypothetical protein